MAELGSKPEPVKASITAICEEHTHEPPMVVSVILLVFLFFIETLALMFLWNNLVAIKFGLVTFNYVETGGLFLIFKLLFARVKF